MFSPFLKEWNAFSGNYSEWSEALWLTNWDRFVSYVDRWHAIYEKVAKAIADKGGKLVAPPPQEMPKDALDSIKDAFKKAGGAVESVWGLAKIAIYGGLAIGGIFVISKLVDDFRSK